MAALDVRWPIGALWIVIGVLLLGYGVAAGTTDTPSLGVDRWWGAVMLVFGIVMLALAARHRARRSPRASRTNDAHSP